MKNVLVIGSMNMDYTIYCDSFPKEGETIFGYSRLVQPGGKGANQAAALGKSKLVNVRFVGARGNDSDGERIEKILNECGVNTFLTKTNAETGNATIVVSKNGENKIIIIGGANQQLSFEMIDKNLIEWADYVVLQNEIPDATNKKVLELCYALGKKTIYNPAPYRKFDYDYFKYVDFFIPNRTELIEYAKTEDIDEGINKLLSLGVKNLIVTLGTAGSLFANKTEMFHVDAFKVKAVDTVAAGDTYVGYFVAGLANGYSIKDSMLLASKASSITVTRSGSIVSIPILNEMGLNIK